MNTKNHFSENEREDSQNISKKREEGQTRIRDYVILIVLIILFIIGAVIIVKSLKPPESPAPSETNTESGEESSESSESETSESESSVTPSSSEDPTETSAWDPVYPSSAPINPQGSVTIPSWITQDLLTVSPMHRPGTPLDGVNYICIHYVGNTNSTAMDNRNYFEENPDGRSVSSHFIVDLSGSILQCVPVTEVAFAQGTKTGHNYNTDTISIENCHRDNGVFTDATYASLIKLTAWLLETYNLPTDRLIRHQDVSGKLCPLAWSDETDGNGKRIANPGWIQFKEDVENYRINHPSIGTEFP